LWRMSATAGAACGGGYRSDSGRIFVPVLAYPRRRPRVTGIHRSANCGICRSLDTGHKARYDKRGAITEPQRMTVEEPQAPKAPAKARALRPRDAATLIIVDNSSGEPRVLLGRRRLDMVFMPGRYVFPGGRVDPADKQIVVEED